MADSSFDIVSKLDQQEIDNAINQTQREISQRFDFKNTGATIERSGDLAVEISANADDRATAVTRREVARSFERNSYMAHHEVAQLVVGELRVGSADLNAFDEVGDLGTRSDDGDHEVSEIAISGCHEHLEAVDAHVVALADLGPDAIERP